MIYNTMISMSYNPDKKQGKPSRDWKDKREQKRNQGAQNNLKSDFEPLISEGSRGDFTQLLY